MSSPIDPTMKNTDSFLTNTVSVKLILKDTQNQLACLMHLKVCAEMTKTWPATCPFQCACACDHGPEIKEDPWMSKDSKQNKSFAPHSLFTCKCNVLYYLFIYLLLL